METLQRTANRGSISTGYDIDNSVKLEADNNEWFYRASPTEGNRRTFTFSFWIKRTGLGTVNASGVQYVAGQGQHGRMYFTSDYFGFRFDDGHDTRDITTLHRDPSAWLHVVVAVDTNQLSSSNRVKIYFNGVQTTAIDFDGGSYPDIQDQSSGWFTTNYLTVGTAPFGGSYNVGDGDYDMRGYLAEFCAVDGQQLAPTDFGEFDSDSGIWKPKDVSGIDFGSEGYYLDFADASDLGDDESGNGNDFVENNIAAADQAQDTPTNNFCTLNFNTGYIQGSDATTFTQGATTRQGGSSSYNGALGTIGINPFVGSAKWYWEVELSANNNGNGIELGAGWLATSIIQSTTADKATAGNNAGFQIWTSFNWSPPTEGTGADGDVFGFLLQCDSSNPNLKIYKNDTLFTTRHTATSYDFENDFYFPVVFIYNTGMKAFCNFGNPFDATVSSGNTDPNGYGNFEFDTKSGYALCSKNLAEFG